MKRELKEQKKRGKGRRLHGQGLDDDLLIEDLGGGRGGAEVRADGAEAAAGIDHGGSCISDTNFAGNQACYREAGITWFRMSRNYMVSEKWSSWEVVVFPSDHF